MSKYGKEIVIGVVPVLIAFLLFLGVNIIPIVFMAAFLGAFVYMTRVRNGMNVGSERKARSRTPAYMTFDDIGGQERAKEELKEALDFLIRAEDIQRLGIRPLKGILLTGPPGTGKTLMAKASAHYTNSVFMAASGSEFVEMYVGVGASRIRDLFKEARTRAVKENKNSAIVFIDEIDVIGGKRDGGQHREYDQTLNQLLTEMDGIHTDETPRVLIMAATNRKEMLDPALLRPGRFDRHIEVDLPDKKGRLHILNIHAKNKPLSDNIDMELIARETFHFSGAQLESVMNEAAIYAMRDNADKISQEHLSLAVDKVMLGEKTDRESTKEERERVAMHELGHAIAAELVRPGSVSQVSLSPRGKALGFVRHNPQQDQYLYTKEQIEHQIMIALGGAVAEEMFYGGRSTGSRNDFEQALNMVRTMMDSGLTRLGIIDRDMVTKEELMKENAAILNQLMTATRNMLEQHRKVFEESLDILIAEEVLSGNQFRELLQRSINQQIA
ncbi:MULTISPECIES: AAA family ATPase [Paenibacillus]|uniref:ATPase n=1 Tax=Paenibacillus naphthalenovorans TaxID=162209 RepID=A0A0U2VGM7_9BACL|nr:MULTISPECIES: AAA family ATPase [Paenibacillus]ALS22627.1 ATPase [Paenibacillus naphthalenovorans]NTZ17760.1 AAA family ATPase [Paenibacillus sp. JMULE4]GCL70424.1 ATPase [Paenibacillus naphthalenovorans]SDH82753.1 ATP-dependent metalloprotease FtsH [Paenibacillus naphthalenovorans]